MNVIVTGGAGFIGSHVAERLVKDGCNVSIIDDMNDFYSPALKRANLTTIQAAGRIKFHQSDIRDEETISQLIKDVRPDAIIHLAARAGIRPSLDDPLLYESVNVRGTLALLEGSRHAGVQKFVFASSSSIYGVSSSLPFRESDCVNLPISPYAATKIAGEKMCFAYSHLYGLSAICLRLFSVYGPRQRPDLAIRKFTECIENGRPIIVYGDGSSARDYTYVDDIVNGVVAALHYDCSFEVFNLGGSRPVSLKTLIHTLELALNRSANVQWIASQSGELPITYADISKARAAIGYAPRMPFEQGISTFVKWYRSMLTL